MEDVLLLYSGGKDSLLSASYLLQEGYHVNLIHYDNCSMIGTEQIQKGTDILEKKFGSNNITFLGIASIISEIRRLKQIENIPISDIISKYGNITLSQYQCLICRSAMYFYSAVVAQDRNIKYIAEGARKIQLFAIEQPIMIKHYKDFLNKYGINLLLPVYDLTDDNYRENELYRLDIIECSRESKCVLGYPLKEEVSQEVITGIEKLYEDIIEPKLDNMMNDKNVTEPIKILSKKLNKDRVNWL